MKAGNSCRARSTMERSRRSSASAPAALPPPPSAAGSGDAKAYVGCNGRPFVACTCAARACAGSDLRSFCSAPLSRSTRPSAACASSCCRASAARTPRPRTPLPPAATAIVPEA